MDKVLTSAIAVIERLKAAPDDEHKTGTQILQDIYANIDKVQGASIDLREAVTNLDYSLRVATSSTWLRNYENKKA